MPSLNHLHSYVRLKTRKGFYRCINPDCSHILNKELMDGRRALCFCGNPYIINKAILRLAKPHCENCFKKKHKENYKEMEIHLTELLQGDL